MCWFRKRRPVATITTIEGKRHYTPDIIIHSSEGSITGRLPFKLTAEEARDIIDQLTGNKK